MLPIIFIVPVLQIVILGYAATLDVRNIGLLVLDSDKSKMSRLFVDRFVNSGYFELIDYVDNQKEVDKYLDRNKVTLAIIISTDFSKQIISGEQTEVALIVDGADAIM